jgi:hypothetical protein
MRRQLSCITVVGTLALLAACGKKETTDAAVEPATTAEPAVVESSPPPPAPIETLPPPAAETRPAPSKPTSTASTKPPAPKPPKPSQPQPIPAVVLNVPSGTEIPLSLTTGLTSKTAKVGDPVKALTTSDITVDGRVAIAAGTTVAGQVLQVESGSAGIGGKPSLVLAFDRLELPGGTDIPISGEITQKGKSDTAGDTAKIVGGTALGAIIGNKVIKGDKGKVIGGLLGGAAGAVTAQKTGTEARLAEGTAMSLVLAAPVAITK